MSLPFIPVSTIPFDQAAAEGVCVKVVAAHRKLFAAFPQVTVEDLLQECLCAVWKATSTFREGKGATWTTWVGRCAHFRLIDLYRSSLKKHKHETTFAENTTQLESVENLSDELLPTLDRSLDAAEKIFEPYARTGPHRYTRPQLAACIALREQLKTSYRGVIMTLRNHPHMRERLGLVRIPDHSTLAHAHRRMMRRPRKNQHGQPVQHHDDRRHPAPRAHPHALAVGGQSP